MSSQEFDLDEGDAMPQFFIKDKEIIADLYAKIAILEKENDRLRNALYKTQKLVIGQASFSSFSSFRS